MRKWDSMSGIPLPIQLSEIESYMRLEEIKGPIEQQRLIKRLKTMDKIYREYYGRHQHNAGRNKSD